VQQAVLRWRGGHRRAVMVAKRRSAVRSNTVGGPARGRWGWWPRRSGCRPCLRHRVGVLGQRPAGVRCGRPASTRASPRDAVQCLVRASGRPGVRRPAWASGVRAIPRPRCPTGVRSWTGGGGQAAAWPGGPGSAWSPAVSTAGSSAARVGIWRSRLAQAVLGQRRHRLGLGRRRGRWLGSGWVARVADQDRPDAREDRPLAGEPRCAAR
jgi:hypothetical protein